MSRLHPGIVVLLEPTLHRFFLDYYLGRLRRPDLYVTRMAEHYGVKGLATAQLVLGPWLDGGEARIEERDLLRAIERLTRLTLFKTDRRGAAGPKPAPVVRKVAAAQVAAPSSKRPHHMPHRDPRGGRPVTVETRSGHRPSFRSGEARLGREVKGRR